MVKDKKTHLSPLNILYIRDLSNEVNDGECFHQNNIGGLCRSRDICKKLLINTFKLDNLILSARITLYQREKEGGVDAL